MENKFAQMIHDKTPVLVDFYADWCGPCKMMAPILEDFKKIAGDRIRVIKINVDKNPDLSGQYNIQTIPTIMIFREGEVRFRKSGVMQLPELQQEVEKVL